MAVRLQESITVYYGTSARKVSLYSGDIASLTQSEAVDFLVVSAFPNDYAPFPGCTIGDLAAKGVSVKELSRDKAADYRPEIPCWISKPVSGQDYKRILVYEPSNPKKNSCAQVSYVFSAITEFMGNDVRDTKAAVSLFSTHYGGVSKKDMLTALFYAAVHWGAMKFPFKEIKIVMEEDSQELKNVFHSLKANYENMEKLNISSNYKYFADESVRKVNSITVRPGDVLTKRQLFGIMMYTSGYYGTMHRILKENNRDSEEHRNHMPLFEACDTALMNIKPYTKTPLYRGQTTMKADEREKHIPGADIATLSYTSYAYEPGGFYNSRRYKFDMEKTYTASLVEAYSWYRFEKEVLFVRGMIYVVKSAKKSNKEDCYVVEEKYNRFRR